MEKLAEWLFVGALVVCLLLEIIGTPIVNAVKKNRSSAERKVDAPDAVAPTDTPTDTPTVPAERSET